MSKDALSPTFVLVAILKIYISNETVVISVSSAEKVIPFKNQPPSSSGVSQVLA